MLMVLYVYVILCTIMAVGLSAYLVGSLTERCSKEDFYAAILVGGLFSFTPILNLIIASYWVKEYVQDKNKP